MPLRGEVTRIGIRHSNAGSTSDRREGRYSRMISGAENLGAHEQAECPEMRRGPQEDQREQQGRQQLDTPGGGDPAD